jgi:hypothetical protein
MCRPAAHREVPQRDVVLLGAGQVLQQVAELVGLDDPQVHVEPAVGASAHGVLAGVEAGSTCGSSS